MRCADHRDFDVGQGLLGGIVDDLSRYGARGLLRAEGDHPKETSGQRGNNVTDKSHTSAPSTEWEWSIAVACVCTLSNNLNLLESGSRTMRCCCSRSLARDARAAIAKSACPLISCVRPARHGDRSPPIGVAVTSPYDSPQSGLVKEGGRRTPDPYVASYPA